MNRMENDGLATPTFGVALTVVMYVAALAIHARWKFWHPLLLCSVGIIGVLLLFRIPYESYAEGGRIISFGLGPATVALAVPLYKHRERIRAYWKPLVGGVVAGAGMSLAANAVLVLSLGGSRELLLTMLPKSATTPISIELVSMLGGIPELGAVFTVLTGLFGSMTGTWFLHRIGVKSDLAVGLAMGTAAHGIGTAKVLRDSELQGAYAGLAMGMTGVALSLVTVPLYLLLF